MPLPRLHLPELLDQPWLPWALRRWITDYLQIAAEIDRPYSPAAPLLRGVLTETGQHQVLDLCSGAGGPSLAIRDLLAIQGLDFELTLSDLHPRVRRWSLARRHDRGIHFVQEPVDARQVPRDLPPVRTLFTALHHFPPDDARAVLADAARPGGAVAVFEATERRPITLAVMFLTPLMVWLYTLRMRPVRLSRLVFTYLLPVVPACVLWDGLASCLRSYTPEEMVALGRSAAPAWRWEAGTRTIEGPMRMTWLIGLPPPKA